MHQLESRIDVAEAQLRFPELLDRAGNGEDIQITRPGRPTVRLTVADERPSPFAFRAEVIRRMRELANTSTTLGASVAELKAEGRR